MGFNSAFKGLTTTIVTPPSNASKWQMGFNSAFKGLTTTIVTPPSNASKWQMGFNSAFKELNREKFVGFLNLLEIRGQLLENHQNSANVI
jgi:hypothetical protein